MVFAMVVWKQLYSLDTAEHLQEGLTYLGKVTIT